MIYTFKRDENSGVKTVVGDFEDLLEKLLPHPEWDPEDTQHNNFIGMVKYQNEINAIHVYCDYDDGERDTGYVEESRSVKAELLAYVNKYYNF